MQPIPQPNMLQLSQNTLSESQESMGHLQENLELQPIASISRSINVAPINVEINKVPSNNCEIRTTSRSPVQPTSQFSRIPNSLHESPEPLEHLKETLVSQPIPSISRTINVAPINVKIIEVQSNDCDIRTTEQPTSQQNSLQLSQIPNTLHESPEPLEHLQKNISRMINVAPINVVSYSISDPQTIQVSNEASGCLNNQVPMQPPTNLLCLNTNRYNRNMIGYTGSMILSITISILAFFVAWNLHVTHDMNSFVISWYILNFCFSIGLPALYFILNPGHLKIAVQVLPC